MRKAWGNGFTINYEEKYKNIGKYECANINFAVTVGIAVA